MTYDANTPMPCPFCGDECHVESMTNHANVSCDDDDCGYKSCSKSSRAEAIAVHNRVCRAVKAAKGEMI